MDNRDTRAAREYHNRTKHSYIRLQTSRHYLDWDNQPIPYKIYTSLDPMPLPRAFAPSAVPALDAIAASAEEASGARVPDLEMVARLSLYSNGITKMLRTFGGEMPFRAAACTGALYHIELYWACGDLPGLPAGVYHYAAHDHALRRLRTGDFRDALVEATGAEPSVAEAPAVLIATSTFWRNAWKYEARAYRHSFWDGGTVLANLLAVAAAESLPARLVLGFADGEVNRLIDVDPDREAAIALVALGRGAGPPPPAPAVAPLGLPTAPLSRTEVDYPLIRAAHAASSLAAGLEAAAWREAPAETKAYAGARASTGGAATPLRPLEPDRLPAEPIERVIRRRGSTRAFARSPIAFAQLSTVLDRSVRAVPSDCLRPSDGALSEVYLIVNAVDGLAPGAYFIDPGARALEPLKTGDFRAMAGTLALGQDLGADAAVNVYFLADLEPILARFGNRGYRVAQLMAAIAAGRMYLASYALGLGATGLTFFDDDVTRFFSPHAAGKSVLFLIAIGHPARRVFRPA